MNLLALDLGTHTGWALGRPGLVVSGTETFKENRYSGGGMRYLRFRRWLEEIHIASPLTEVVFEEVRAHKGTSAAHVYGGLLGTLTAWCEDAVIPYEGVSVGTIKRSFTGKGNANKAAMILECRRRGYDIAENADNEADAIALFHHRIDEIAT